MMHTDPSQPLLPASSLNRRGFLKLGGVATGTMLTPGLSLAKPSPSETAERSLALYNLHTGEKLTTVYWAEGHYVLEAMAAMDALLRDHRQDEQMFMDPDLIDVLYAISRKIEARHPLHVISGYRSPETNAYLHKRGRKVAKESQHMYGKAVDFFVPGRQLSQVRQAALSLRRGGVGYYPKSNFVHVDTARFRTW